MGFREKNAWICVVSILFVFTPYFYFSLQDPVEHLPIFFMTVLGLVFLLVVFHTINAIGTKSIRDSGNAPQLDELDKFIELQASKWGGIVLATLVLSWSVIAMVSIPVEPPSELSKVSSSRLAPATFEELDFKVSASQARFGINLLFAGFVFSSLVYYGKIIASYRGISNG
jgi:uncharacterized membrane protein